MQRITVEIGSTEIALYRPLVLSLTAIDLEEKVPVTYRIAGAYAAVRCPGFETYMKTGFTLEPGAHIDLGRLDLVGTKRS